MYLEVKDLKKSYGKDQSYIQVLKGVNTSVEKGQMCVIQGTSGSGKSTLLNCIGGLDEMDSGSVTVDGKEIFGLKPAQLSAPFQLLLRAQSLPGATILSCLASLPKKIPRDVRLRSKPTLTA